MCLFDTTVILWFFHYTSTTVLWFLLTLLVLFLYLRHKTWFRHEIHTYRARKCPSIMHLTKKFYSEIFFLVQYYSKKETVTLEFLDPIYLSNSQKVKFKDYLNNQMFSSRHPNNDNYTYSYTLLGTFTDLILKEHEIGILSNIHKSKLFQLAFSKSSSSKRMLAFLLASAACLSLAWTMDSIQRWHFFSIS